MHDSRCQTRRRARSPGQHRHRAWNPVSTACSILVHRDPKTYNLQCLASTHRQDSGWVSFVRPHNIRTIFDTLPSAGTHQLRSGAGTFPAKPDSPVRTLPGLGHTRYSRPIRGRTLYSSENNLPEKQGKTPLRSLQSAGQNRYRLPGRATAQTSDGAQSVNLEMELLVKDDAHAELRLGKQIHKLELGHWRPIIEIGSRGFLVTVHAITRLILTQVKPCVRL